MAPHVDERGAVGSAIEAQDAAVATRVELQAHAVADLDRGLVKLNSRIAKAAERGRTNGSLSAIDDGRKGRQVLAGGRRGTSTVVDLKAERAALAAKGRQSEPEAASIRGLAELIGADTRRALATAVSAGLAFAAAGKPAKIRSH